MNHATTPATGITPARAGTLGLPPCPRIPRDVAPYNLEAAEADVDALSWIAFGDQRLELFPLADETWSVFDAFVGDSLAEGETLFDAVDNAADELLGVRR